MGQFSWLDCKTGEQVLDDVRRDVYVLVPEKFGGGHIEEKCYDGYGNFGGHDIFDLVAEWNREEVHLRDGEPDSWLKWRFGEEKARQLFEDFRNGVDDETMRERYGDEFKREIGIEIACYDKDNASLRYPIKITHDEHAVYEWCAPSPGDPNQGWR